MLFFIVRSVGQKCDNSSNPILNEPKLANPLDVRGGNPERDGEPIALVSGYLISMVIPQLVKHANP